MTVNLQGIIGAIVALVVVFLVGLWIGYASVQGRWKRQGEALKASQQRLVELEQAHEVRLRETTQQLRRDYEAELAATIEHYQDQLSDKTLELKQTYDTRLEVLQQGVTDSAAERIAPVRDGSIEPVSDDSEIPLSQPEVLHLKRQYETRLKEAAQKLQHAYEKQLAQHAKTVTADLQADYEKRLAEKIEHYDEQFSSRNAQLEKEYASRYEALRLAQGDPDQREPAPNEPNQGEPTQAESAEPVTPGVAVPTPSQIMGTGDETTVTLQPFVRPSSTPVPQEIPSSSSQLTQEDIEARIQEATQQVRHEYEAQLSAKLKEYQKQLTSRMQELEEDYRNRLNTLAESKSGAGQAARRSDDGV